MRIAARTLILLVLLALPTACNEGPPPQRIKVELPAEVLASTDPSKAEVEVRAADGKLEPPGKSRAEFSVEPDAVAGVDAAGLVSCKKTGDATLTATVRGVSASAKVVCRPVARLDVQVPERWDIKKGPVQFDYKAFDAADKELDGVDVVLRSKNTGVVKAEGGQFVPVSVGAAELYVRAGNQEEELKVDIVRQIEPEALPLDDGRRIHFSLEPGKYRLDLELQKEAPVKIEWRGAPYCDYKGQGKTHTSTCVLRAKGGVVFDNPSYINDGSTNASHAGVTIAQVPE